MFCNLIRIKKIDIQNKILYSKIITTFLGKINGVEINDFDSYITTESILKQISNKFPNIELNSEFIKDFSKEVKGYLDYETLERDLEYSINVTEKFENLQFEDYDEINKKWKKYKCLKGTYYFFKINNKRGKIKAFSL